MTKLLSLCFITAVIAMPFSSSAQTQHAAFVSTPIAEVGNNISSHVDQAQATIFNPADALALINATVCSPATMPAPKCDVTSKDFYAIIHVLRWKDPDDKSKMSPDTQNWYVYHSGSWSQEMFGDTNRLYGAKSLYFLYVHLNTYQSHAYSARYEFSITKKLPANIQDLFLLATLGESAHTAGAEKPANVWGGEKLSIDLRPSDIAIDARFITGTSASGRGDELAPAKTFNNEGKYYWDVSVGVPVKKISELKFDSTNNTVAPAQTSTQNTFALFDAYLPPIDLMRSKYNYIPHPIVGVAIAKQPLHKILVGGAIGLTFAEVYAGALFVKQQSLTGLQTGSTASAAQVSAASSFPFKAQFSVGINIPVRGVVDALKKKPTSSTSAAPGTP